MSGRPVFSPSELAAFERASERRAAAEWFRASHPEYASVTARVAELLDADRNASLADFTPPSIPEPPLTEAQFSAVDETAGIYHQGEEHES